MPPFRHSRRPFSRGEANVPSPVMEAVERAAHAPHLGHDAGEHLQVEVRGAHVELKRRGPERQSMAHRQPAEIELGPETCVHRAAVSGGELRFHGGAAVAVLALEMRGAEAGLVQPNVSRVGLQRDPWCPCRAHDRQIRSPAQPARCRSPCRRAPVDNPLRRAVTGPRVARMSSGAAARVPTSISPRQPVSIRARACHQRMTLAGHAQPRGRLLAREVELDVRIGGRERVGGGADDVDGRLGFRIARAARERNARGQGAVGGGKLRRVVGQRGRGEDHLLPPRRGHHRR